jgi:hypothetical protein
VRAAVAALVLVAAVALAGCAASTPSDESPAPGPASGTASTDDLRQVEDIVNDLDSVVGSAEAETETAND